MRIECMQEDVTCPVSPVEGHAASLLPKGKQWKLVWNDEFDGDTLDETKWSYRTYYWGQKSPTFTDHEGVELDGNSHMRMYLICENGQYRSPHLQTGSNSFDIPRDTDGFWPLGKMEKPKFMHRFGYYEIRCRLPKNDGWHAAFWLQTPSIGTAPDPRFCGVECDIMENYRQHTEGKIVCGNGWGGYGKDCVWPGHFQVPYRETADGWHYYGVDWSPEGYSFYMDGVLVGMQNPPECPVSHVEQFILVTTECHGYHTPLRGAGNRLGLDEFSQVEGVQASAYDAQSGYVMTNQPVEVLKKAVLPDWFEVYFVRVYDQVR